MGKVTVAADLVRIGSLDPLATTGVGASCPDSWPGAPRHGERKQFA